MPRAANRMTGTKSASPCGFPVQFACPALICGISGRVLVFWCQTNAQKISRPWEFAMKVADVSMLHLCRVFDR